MGAPIKESDDNRDRDSSFVSKGTRDASLHRLLVAFGVAGTTMAIVILFAYFVSSENIATSEFQDESTSLSSEPAYAEEIIIEPEHLVEDVLDTDIQEPAEMLDQEEHSLELEEIFPSLTLERKNTTVVVNATTSEIISIPLYDNLTATAVDASEEIKAEDPIDEDEDLLPVHDDGEDATGEQSETIDGNDSDDLDVQDDVTADYPKDDDDTGRHEPPEGHEKGSDDDRGKGKKNNHSRKE